MDGLERDTIPDAVASWATECPHCGGTATHHSARALFSGACNDCGHPGTVEFDSTGAAAFILGSGTCRDHKCGDCYPGLGMAVESVKHALQRVDSDIFEQQDSSLLADRARDLALSLRCSPSAALRLLVDTLFADLEAAKTSITTSMGDAATQLATGELS